MKHCEAESRSHMAKLTSCRVSTIGASIKKYTKRVRVGMAIVMNASESARGPMDANGWMIGKTGARNQGLFMHFFQRTVWGVVLQILFFNQF